MRSSYSVRGLARSRSRGPTSPYPAFYGGRPLAEGRIRELAAAVSIEIDSRPARAGTIRQLLPRQSIRMAAHAGAKALPYLTLAYAALTRPFLRRFAASAEG